MHPFASRLSCLLAGLCLGAMPGWAAEGGRRAESQPASAAPAVAAATAPSAEWARTLERVAASVVTIQVNQTRAFDTERSASAQATGFVVDAERGLILTNRHVVTPGPVTAEATFLDREEVQLYPVYRDPVHDFGIYRYDPTKLRYIKPESLPLAPEAAQVGREIRVIGNNAGEQLSILAGTLARLDREAPQYGVGRYNDFNTFYIQAASGTSGGSSGSPVIDVQGRVVALNAGGATGAASSFYLPLGRVQRALQLIRAGKPVRRGTLQTEFRYRPYDELRRLGLQNDTEGQARRAFPSNTGMLVVEDVQPGSACDAVLAPGDVLVRLNGNLVTGFEPLEAVLDDAVGSEVDIEVERGGKTVKVRIRVDDLDAITPASYLEYDNAILHNLSYQMARHFHVPIKGVFVAANGYNIDAAGIPRGAVITMVNKTAITNLDDFIAQVGALPDGQRIALRYFTMEDPRRSQLKAVYVDRRWFQARRCDRDDGAGIWNCADLPPVAAAAAPEAGSARYPKHGDRNVERIAPSLVGITFDMPYAVSGVTERNYRGTGVIIDAARGLVITDRNTVPVSLGDVRLTFAGALEIPARVIYVHPLHNLAVLQYDPKLIGDTPAVAASLSTDPMRPGESVDVIGLDGGGDLQSRTTNVAEVNPLMLPLSRTVQFRDANIEVASLVNPPDDLVGVLADKSGRVRGLWASFATDNGRELVQESRGIPADLVAETLQIVRSGNDLRSLDAEFGMQTLASARGLGLTDEWIRRIQQANPEARNALSITRLVGGTDAAKQLLPGDLLLAIDGTTMTRFRDVERAVMNKDQVQVTVWRADAAKTINVNTTALSGGAVRRVLLWAGATLQSPHRAIAAQRSLAPEGVYVAYFQYGSPASRFGLQPGQRIVEVDGVPTPDIDSFIRAVSDRAQSSSLRIKTLGWNNAPTVITLKPDPHYWPTYSLLAEADGWHRRSLD